MASSFWRSVQSINCWSLTQSTVCQLATRHHGCILALIDISLVMSYYEGMTDRMSELQRVCVVQTVGQINAYCQQIEPAHSACTATTRQESAKRTGCLKLKQYSKREAFINDVCSRLDAMGLRSDDPEENCTVFRDTVYSSAMDSLGPVSRKHQDWFEWMTKKSRDSLKRNTKNTRHT